jgi:hypothetical protein
MKAETLSVCLALLLVASGKKQQPFDLVLPSRFVHNAQGLSRFWSLHIEACARLCVSLKQTGNNTYSLRCILTTENTIFCFYCINFVLLTQEIIIGEGLKGFRVWLSSAGE